MPLPPVANVAKLVIKGSLGGQQCHSIFFALRSGGWDATTLENLVDLAITAWKAQMLPLLATHYTLTAVEARDLSNADGLVIEKSVSAPNTGGVSSGSGLPNNVNLAIKKTSPVGGRSGRGRIFVPLTTTTHQNVTNANQASTTWAESVCTALRAFRSAIEGDFNLSADLGFVSYYAQGIQRAVPLFRTIVDFVCPDKTIDSQRRRLPLRGN